MWCRTWWTERTSMEKWFFISIIIAMIIVLSLIISLSILASQKNQEANKTLEHENENPEKKLCLTSACVNSASTLLESMDLSIDPCDDFYQFSCGNFIKTTNIPDDKLQMHRLSMIEDKLKEQLRTMLEKPIQSNAPKAFQLTKKLYNACMNKIIIERNGLKTIHSILKQLGGWPVVEGDQWDENAFDWKKSIYDFRRIGYKTHYFIKISVDLDIKNSSRRIIVIEQAANLKQQPTFGKRSGYDDYLAAYLAFMKNVAVILGAEIQKAHKELTEVMNFELAMDQFTLSQLQMLNVGALYKLMTVDELQRKVSSIPWLEYINTLLAPDNTINSDEPVVVFHFKYLTDFETLMSRTPKRVQANYIIWKAVASSVPFLNSVLQKESAKLESASFGRTQTQTKAKWLECVDVCNGHFPIATSAFYVREYFKEETKRSVIEMISPIRAEFEDIIKKNDWMDETTKKNALEKARLMSHHVGYPAELLNNKKLDQYYSDLTIDENDFLKSVLNISLFVMRKSFKRLRDPVNKTEWTDHSNVAIVGATYGVFENSLRIPAGTLQGFSFDVDRPRYMNYGAIGYIIGHEFTHGFDNYGRQFDKHGVLVPWWDKATEEAFLKRTQCMINQYSNYTVPELNMKLNGLRTQAENIADNGGIKEAYLAYDKWVQKNGEEAPLPGLNYTGHQLFWISAGSIWCTKMPKSLLAIQILVDVHAPNSYRVNVPLLNSDHFANDFKCPKGSKMNPEHKCHVW